MRVQEDQDLILARALQEQEHAFMLLESGHYGGGEHRSVPSLACWPMFCAFKSAIHTMLQQYLGIHKRAHHHP